MEMILQLLPSVLLTAVCYMGFPLIRLLVNGAKFKKEKAKKIALWNSVVVGFAFCVATILISVSEVGWSISPAVVYFFINRAVLTERTANDEEIEIVEMEDDTSNRKQNKQRFGLAILIAVIAIVCWMLVVGGTIFSIVEREEETQQETTSKTDTSNITFDQWTFASKVVENPLATQQYCEYMNEVEEIVAKAIYREELKKEKVAEYIENLPLTYGEKVILHRYQFIDDDTYNHDIVAYLDERDDVSWEDMKYVLEELGMAVFEDGTIKW